MAFAASLLRRTGANVMQKRALRAAVRDCAYLNLNNRVQRFAAARLRVSPKQAAVRQLQKFSKQDALFSALACSGRQAWMRFRRRALEAHHTISAKRQRLLSLRGRFARGGGGSNLHAASANPGRRGFFFRRYAARARSRHGAAGSSTPTSSSSSAASYATTFSDAWRKYGWMFIGTHFSVYFATLAVLTAAVKNGLLGSSEEEQKKAVGKVADLFEGYLPAAAVDVVRTSPNWGAFAVAWISAKFTEPFRLVVTVFLTPRIHALRHATTAATAAATAAAAAAGSAAAAQAQADDDTRDEEEEATAYRTRPCA